MFDPISSCPSTKNYPTSPINPQQQQQVVAMVEELSATVGHHIDNICMVEITDTPLRCH
ncbi:MAG: hypothetical protein ACOYK8_08425 [Alphaproteobacteria bacterium]